jgi:PBP1b-binding outer membrane lipoprotein LpoB
MQRPTFLFCIVVLQIIFWGCSNTSTPVAKQTAQQATEISDHINTLNSACKNAYTASVAHTVDHPNPTNITLSDLINAGYQPSEGVTITTDNLSDKGGTITCSSPDTWKVRPAVVTVDNNGFMRITLATAISP